MTLTDAVAVPPPCACGIVAVIVTGPPEATAVTVKLTVVAPGAIVTLAGTGTTFVFDDVRLMGRGALCCALRVTVIVPVDCC